MADKPITSFIEKHFLHFNSAALVDAAKGYKSHLESGKKMLISLAGAMSTGELGISLAEMIRNDKVQIISCTGANLEEDLMNLVAHTHYKRIPNYRDLTPEQERVAKRNAERFSVEPKGGFTSMNTDPRFLKSFSVLFS